MKILDTYNALVGAVIAVLTYIFGEHWMLFALFLAFNVADWLTGWAKSRLAHKESSSAGWKGVLKKLGYWMMIAVSFGASAVFVEIGATLGINLQITVLLGWFVLASLIVNELRSILENFVEMGYDVPKILVKGLEVADKAINQSQEDEE
nr:MAG TPA: holin [Caudoviricetes sp.]DAW24256.1 MAG TPA: holin [Caudoviricetes sp.]